jgi:putative ABC transport system substrate-binding protein
MRTIGLLHSGTQDSFTEEVKELISGLGDENYWAGEADLPDGYEPVSIIPVWANDCIETLKNGADTFAKDNNIEVIVAAGGPIPALEAKAATDLNKKPVVFTTVVDPVRLDLVKTLANPCTNLTGMAGKTSETDVGRLIILNQLLPQAQTIGVAIKEERPLRKEQFEILEDAAGAMGVHLEQWVTPSIPLKGVKALSESFGNQFKNIENFALLVTADAWFNNNRASIVQLCDCFNLPAIYQWHEFADIGGLISYGPSIGQAYHSAGVYVGRILRGEPVGNIPVSEPIGKELVINLRTAKKLNIPVPDKLKQRATRLIPE